MSQPTIRIAESEEAIRACYPGFSELRPHLAEDDFVERVQRQRREHGYTMAYIEEDGAVVAGAGYRVAEYLAWGRTFYLDDLITATSARGRGYGGALLDWLLERARELDCDQFHLDSGTHRYAAHRLYMGRKLNISSYHFSRDIE
ncbi:MAG: GNAT family N-acetyltransferase [Gemmatimonadota bacterium]